jgi:hypothetical protein
MDVGHLSGHWSVAAGVKPPFVEGPRFKVQRNDQTAGGERPPARRQQAGTVMQESSTLPLGASRRIIVVVLCRVQ